jgi:hypothetical protein
MEVSGQLRAPAALPPGKQPPVIHWIGGWVGPRAVLDAVVKTKIPSPRQGSVMSSCKDNNLSGYLKGGGFSDQLRDYYLLKKDPAL